MTISRLFDNRPEGSINPASSRNLKPPPLGGGVFTDHEVSEICRLIRSAFCPKDEQLAPVLSGVRAVSSRSTIRPSRVAPNGCASCRRPITMTMHALERCSMCVSVLVCHCDTMR
jgi:hypothetical protein